MDIASALKEFMFINGIEKQKALADLLHTSQQNVSNWLKGKTPRGEDLRKINHLLSTYRGGSAHPPAPPKPTFDPAISEIHEIKVAPAVQQPPSYVRRADDIIEEARAAEDAFFNALPGELEYQRMPTLDFQGMKVRPDYLDAYVCAEFKYVPARNLGNPLQMYSERTVLQLVTVRRILELTARPRKCYVTVICLPEMPARVTSFNRLMTLAALHDVRIIIGQTPEQCADAFAEVVNEVANPSAEDDFLDDPDSNW